MRLLSRALGLTILGVLALLTACQGGQAESLVSIGATTPRDVSTFGLFSEPVGAAAGSDHDSPSLEDVLTGGLYGAGATPTHLVFRGTADTGSVRCAWRGSARTVGQREQEIRFWLGLGTDEALPAASGLVTQFMSFIEGMSPRHQNDVKARFLPIVRGGLSTEYLFLTCHADYAVQQYFLGSGPTGAANKLGVAYDRMGEARSYDLYSVAHEDGLFGNERPLTEGEYEAYLDQLLWEAETFLTEMVEGRESVVFLAPMGAHNAIAVEAWQAVAQWDLQTDDDDVVQAVRYGAPAGNVEHTQTLANLRTRITTAAAADDFADDRIANASGLTQYYRDIGAYGDITPADGSTATFTPAQPPPMLTCAGGTVVTNPGANRPLVHDCEALLAAKDTLRGTATLNWSASTAIASWDGITTGGTPSRVTKVELSNESLTGTIPAELGSLFELTTLKLNTNSLTGTIPTELGLLDNLEEIKLSGNQLTGCIPVALEGVATSDLSSLNLLYCSPPAPQGLSAGTAAETSIPLTWSAVSNTSKYRVEYRSPLSSEWTVDDDTITGTSHTVDELDCGHLYRFRVSAYGSGTTYAAAWSAASEAASEAATKCNQAPEFGEPSYTFSVSESATENARVGAVSATDPDAGDTVTYEVTAGDDEGKFAVDENSGEITVAAALDYETVDSYTLTVEAEDNRGGTATATVEIEVTNVIELPGTPQNLRAAVGAGLVTLEWDAPDDPTVTGYQVLRRQPAIHASGEFEVIVEDTGSVDVIYVDTSVEPQTQYVYRVAAVNSDGIGNRSSFVSVTTRAAAAPAPEGLSVSLAEGAFSMTWTAVSGADSYGVQYRTGGDGEEWTDLEAVEGSSASFSPEGGPVCGTTYEFRVRARGDGTTYATDWGEPSDTESVTTTRCNDPPEFGAPSYAFLTLEGSAANTLVGTVSATDPDDDTVTYSIASGNEDGTFAIAAGRGAITLTAQLGAAVGTTYGLSVEASDGHGGVASAAVTVTVAAGGCSGGIAAPDPDDNPGLVSDCETLLGLKGALAGTATLNWSGAAAITGWRGVTVGGSPLRVTELNLRSRSLTGMIPPELGGLSKLQVLNLQYNSLTGELPAALGGLSELTTLWVNNNGLTGGIPEELGMLSNLIWMAVSVNGLSGEIPAELGGLPYLSQLLLQNNSLEGELPRELGDLTSLLVLQMNNNSLSGPIPSELEGLSGLSVLHLSGNTLEGCLPPSWRSISTNDFSALGLPYCAESGRAPAPGSVTASVSGDTFNVAWGAVTGAGGYEVEYRISGSGADWEVAATGTEVSLTFSPEGGPECETTYEFRVRAYGDGATYAGVLGDASGDSSATTGPCSQDPAFDEPSYSFTIAENAETGAVVGSVSATDPDEGDSVTYWITAGDDEGKFAIGENTGEITVAAALDYETADSYSLTVEARDGNGGTATAEAEIVVTDAPEDPAPAPEELSVSLSEGTFSVSWNAVTGAARYEVQHRISGSGEDWTALPAVDAVETTYSPVGGPTCGSTYEFRVRAYGDGETYVADWGAESEPESVETEACNQAPVFDDDSYAFSVREDASEDDVVESVSATDPDEDDTVMYMITAGNDAGTFDIDASTGAITVAATLDYETEDSYTLTVEASDGNGGSETATVVISVIEASCSNGIAVPEPTDNAGLVGDCTVLLAARDTLAGEAALDWSAFTAITDWTGITVGGSPLRVTKLGLTNRGLNGTVPPSLGQLTKLAVLNLSANALTGAIPAELGDLTGLEWLWLYTNRLTGSIPTELGGLTNLRQLYLSSNLLDGPIPAQLGDLSSLERLSLHDNQLTGSIPTELGGLMNLRHLYLGNNLLDGSIPTQLGGLSKLELLSLSSNQLTGAILSEFGGLTKLHTLYLHNNQLAGPIPPQLGALAELRTLSLNINQLTGAIPPELGGLTNLTRLSLHTNQLTGAIPWQMGELTNLRTLELPGELTGCLPPALRSVDRNNLANLGLVDCTESGPALAPVGVSVSVTEGAFSIAWSAVSGADMYEVQYRTGGSDSDWASAGTAAASPLTFSPEGSPTCGVAYEFRVRSHGDASTYASGWGPESEAASATAPCMPT